MRIIFLDIDGVLKKGLTSPICEFEKEKPWEKFDKLCCYLVENLCLQVRAYLVISSNWRTAFDRKRMEQILGRLGYFLHPHDWRTDAKGPRRGNEIDRWLANHLGIDEYLIIDDNNPREFTEHQQKYLITTETYDGFQSQHLEKSLKIITDENVEVVTCGSQPS